MKRNSSISIAPSLEPVLNTFQGLQPKKKYGKRFLTICSLAILIGAISSLISKALLILINLFTNIFFYQTFSIHTSSPENNTLGIIVIVVPVIGGLIIGLMARFGSSAIRGHGIPEAMEQILVNKSRVPPRLTFLKPLSAAISIGTGGPFGAEGPIIATGGALGSFLGQIFKTSSYERKLLLAAGAAAGMAATFNTPISAIFLAIELLLFEYSGEAILVVTSATIMSVIVKIYLDGFNVMFPVNSIPLPDYYSIISYMMIGLSIGFVSVIISKSIYFIEDLFEKLPFHWMWWPALGAIVVGIIGFVEPKTLGVGYSNIENIINLNTTGAALLSLFILKYISWSISLGSGTSGGTLAPLLTIGGGFGAMLGTIINAMFPFLHINLTVSALVGMAALFAGASGALLTSILFAFESTFEPNTILPLIIGCSASFLIAKTFNKNTIMTEKIVRKGIKVPDTYSTDFLDHLYVKNYFKEEVVSFKFYNTIESLQEFLTNGEGKTSQKNITIIDDENKFIGMINRYDVLETNLNPKLEIKNLCDISSPFINLTNTLREAIDIMAYYKVDALPVLSNTNPGMLTGIISQTDILTARHKHMHDNH